MIQIIIPSYKRSNKVDALKCIPYDYIPDIIVREEEYDEYAKNYSDVANIVPISGVSGIADTRKFITEKYAGQRILMLDDDTVIYASEVQGAFRRPTKMVTRDEFYDCLKFIETAMDAGYVHGHLRYPVFPVNAGRGLFAENSYGFTNTFYNLEVLTADAIGYGTIELMEDTHAYLKLIKAGHPHCAVFKYLVKSGKGQAPGGCSEIRNTDNHNACLEAIAAEFPEHAKIFERDTTLKLGEGKTKSIRITAGSRRKSKIFKLLKSILDDRYSTR